MDAETTETYHRRSSRLAKLLAKIAFVMVAFALIGLLFMADSSVAAASGSAGRSTSSRVDVPSQNSSPTRNSRYRRGNLLPLATPIPGNGSSGGQSSDDSADRGSNTATPSSGDSSSGQSGGSTTNRAGRRR
mgnify:FL=1